MFMDKRRPEGACAGADGHRPYLEVGKEGVPLLRSGHLRHFLHSL